MVVRTNTLEMKTMHSLENQQKHTSLPGGRLKKKETEIAEDLIDSNHHNDHSKDIIDHLLETDVVISRKQIHGIRQYRVSQFWRKCPI